MIPATASSAAMVRGRAIALEVQCIAVSPHHVLGSAAGGVIVMATNGVGPNRHYLALQLARTRPFGRRLLTESRPRVKWMAVAPAPSTTGAVVAPQPERTCMSRGRHTIGALLAVLRIAPLRAQQPAGT